MPRTTPGRLKRLRSIHRRMSFAAFERMPRQLGWKHEYYGGMAHITPSKGVVTFRLDLTPRRCPRREGIRRVMPADAPALLEGFLAAFAHAPEYASYSAALYRKSAAKYVQGFFGDVRGRWSPVSVLAETGGRVIGAALVKVGGKYPLLDCLFIRPEYVRQGWATALTGRVVRGLLRRGETRLLSHVMLANEASLAWHEHFGFREVPDLSVTSQRFFYYWYERDRHRRLGNLPAAEMAKLEEQLAYWDAARQRQDEMEKRDFWSVHPRFRR